MFNKFTAAVQGNNGQRGEKYELNEVLAILDMANNEVSREEIANITGRSKDSLNYKVFEKQTTIKGKTSCRSILRHMYEDHTVKGSKFVDGETFLRRLYAAYGVTAPEGGEALAADCEGRIADYQASLEGDEATAPSEGEEQAS